MAATVEREDGVAGSLVRLTWFGLDLQPDEARLQALSPAERARAARFRFERDRRRYLAARCALRERLAAATGQPPGALKLVAGPHGKPRLDAAGAPCFNLAHSGDRALLALGGPDELGVDLELLQPVADFEPLARAHFRAEEQAALMALPEPAREAGFLRLWTRKEACLKAIGTGLSLAPSAFSVGLAPGPRVVDLAWPGGRARLELRDLDAGPGAVAALARVLA